MKWVSTVDGGYVNLAFASTIERGKKGQWAVYLSHSKSVVFVYTEDLAEHIPIFKLLGEVEC